MGAGRSKVGSNAPFFNPYGLGGVNGGLSAFGPLAGLLGNKKQTFIF
jgi:hypothetical protein